MQQQVLKRNMSSDFAWASGADGGVGQQQSSTSGSGSWTSTANPESSSSPASSWQVMAKSDSASDAGDETSSVKSGSTVTSVTNMTPQSQDSTNTSSAATLQTSSSPWSTSTSTLPSMDSSPWGNSSSSAVSSMGWSSNPSGLSLSSNNQGHNVQPGSSIIGNNSAFNSSSCSSSSSVWSSSLTGSTPSLPLSMGAGLQVNAHSSQWPSSSMLGNIGDLSKSSDSAWNHPTSSLIDNKDLGGTSSDPRMWGMSSDKPGESQWDASKSQWGNHALAASGDHSTSGTELSFAQATLKGLKVAPSSASAPQTLINSRQEDILRAIESHDGWGSRPIRQDTSWDVDSSPMSQRKVSTDANAAASNVWNNSNGTAIWEAVRENQSSNWSGAASSGGNSWNVDKDPSSWGGAPKPAQDANTWNVGANADPKTFATWGATGAAGDASNKIWGQKTEVGSWGESGVQRTAGISSWGDDGDGGAWEEQRRMAASVGGMQVLVPPSPSLVGPAGMPGIVPPGIPGMNPAVMNSEPAAWNDGQKPGWNSASSAAINRTNMDEPWNKPPPTRTGWGDAAQDGAEVDNGTSIWVAATPKQLQPQAKVAGWGDTAQQNQWNAAVGAKAKLSGWEDVSWSMAQRAKPLPSQPVPHKYMSSGSNPPTQMRAKLLQQLMDMGFRKEEAQNALITNNLNLEMAINDLKSGNVNSPRKDLDMDMFQTSVNQSRMPYITKGGLGADDLSDMRPDQVPTYNSLQNSQFPNAQIPNQPFMQSNASLPASSLNASSSSITSSLQQKLMHKMQQQQAPPSFGQRGPLPPVGGTGTTSQVPPQQQQQILSQLRQAVSSGLISQQLLNYQLPHNILLLLQQLLQLQTAHQNMVAKQQQMLQQARAAGSRSNPQLEQMSGFISGISQQMINIQKQLQQAQSTFFSSQKPPSLSQTSGTVPPQASQQTGINMMDNLDALSSDLANVALQSQSRLTTQWKPSIDVSAADTATTNTTPVTAASKVDDAGDSKAPGTKGLLQTSSSPNLNLIPGGLGMTGDKTWSSSMSSSTSCNWPMSSSDNIASSSQADIKACNSSSTSTSLLAGLPSGLTDVIPEFVPGKPWQGLAKNVEDDPHVTPGSIQLQRSLSVNRVHDDSLHNLDGHKLSSSSWGTSLKSDNSLGLSQLGSRPPPSMSTMTKGIGQHWQPAAHFNRQNCWPHSANSAFTKVSGSSWNDNTGAISSWLLLKNLTVDPNTVRALCAQHGTLISFYTVAQGQLALVQYSSREIAFGAQQRLNNFQMGTSIVTAEFIGETDAQRFTAQIPPPQPTALPPMNTSPWSQAPPSAPFHNVAVRGGDPWSNSMLSQPNSKFASAGENPWGLWDRSDHNFNPLSNILGGESM